MKLTYRGVAYESSVAGAPALETGEMGVHLGKTDKMKHFSVTFRQPSAELTYRGVRHSR